MRTIREIADDYLESYRLRNPRSGFLLRLMDTPGDLLRVRLRKKNLMKLKTRARIAKAFTPEEKTRLMETAAKARSPHLYPGLMLALTPECAMRK